MSEDRSIDEQLDAMDMSETIEWDNGQTFTLADIMGVDINTVQEYEYIKFPVGTYRWQLDSVKIGKQTMKDGKPDFVVDLGLKMKEKKAWVDPTRELKEEDFMDKEMHNRFQIRTNKGMERWKKFLRDAGYTSTEPGSLLEHTKQAIADGLQLWAPVTHSKSNGIDYANINTFEVKPIK